MVWIQDNAQPPVQSISILRRYLPVEQGYTHIHNTSLEELFYAFFLHS